MAFQYKQGYKDLKAKKEAIAKKSKPNTKPIIEGDFGFDSVHAKFSNKDSNKEKVVRKLKNKIGKNDWEI